MRYDNNQLYTVSKKPKNDDNLWSKILWSTVSNAALTGKNDNDNVRHCGLVVLTPIWDGTGCEFDSWQCRIYIPCSLSLRLLGSLRGSLGTYGLTRKLCLKKDHLRSYLFFRVLAQSYTPNIYTSIPTPSLYNPLTIVLHKRLSAPPSRTAHTPTCWVGTKRNKDFHPATPQPIGNQKKTSVNRIDDIRENFDQGCLCKVWTTVCKLQTREMIVYSRILNQYCLCTILPSTSDEKVELETGR